VTARWAPRRRPLAIVVAASVAIALTVAVITTTSAAPAAAQGQEPTTDLEQQLATKYAPIVMIKAQLEECDDDGEPYAPMAVDPLFDNRLIALRQVGNDDPVMQWAPAAADVFQLGKAFYLDFPGSSLAPGCVYERQFRLLVEGERPAVYAHVVVQPDRPDELVLQFWLFWYFNNWNNTHEGDWEMVQIVFPASTAEEALRVDPSEVGYAQHEGGERADWDDDKLDKEGTRPVVYSSAGSHASYFGSALYLGRSGSEGFGCDNTDGPSERLDPEAILLPDEPVDDAADPLAWTAFSGRWGERHSGPFNGPDGPYEKTRFERPLDWQDDLRESSVIVPTGDSAADSLVKGFCNVVEWGSQKLLEFKQSPTRALVTLLIFGWLAVFLVRRTSWTLVDPLPIVAPRRGGQIVRATFRAFTRAPATFTVIGLATVPLSLIGGLIAAVVRELPLVGGLISGTDTDGASGLVLSLLIGGLANVFTLVVVNAMAAHVMGELSQGHVAVRGDAIRALVARVVPLVKAAGRAAVIVIVLLISVVGIPFGIRQLVRYQFMPQVVMLEGLGARSSLARSSQLVRGRWWHTAVVIGVIDLLLAVFTSAVGLVILVLLRPPFWLLTILVGLATMLIFPLAAIATTLLYGDAVHERESESAQGAEPQPVA
jgi:hypothetical protein